MQKFLTVFGLIGIGFAGRLLPHLPNATPITAITLAARKQLGTTWTYIVPIAAMVISDSIIGFYDWRILISVYMSFCLISGMSLCMRKSSSTTQVVLMAIAASVVFFLVTNFAVWLFSSWYEKSISGLVYCYTLGLPFLRNMMLGDIGYTVVLLGALKVPHLIQTMRTHALPLQIKNFLDTQNQYPLPLQ